MTGDVPPSDADTRYVCVGCGTHWRYDQVRVIACCRECGSGLWALDREARTARPPRASRVRPAPAGTLGR